jgi:hypothetical protein
VEEVTDEVVDLFDRALTNAYARARRELDEFRRSMARSTNEKVVLFRAIGRVVNTDVADADLRAAIFRQVLSENELAATVDDAERITRPLDDNYFDLLGERYSHLRQVAPALLDALSLRSSALDDDGLLDAIDLLRRLNQTGRRRVADSAATNFVPARWQSYVIDADGRIDRRYYELCALGTEGRYSHRRRLGRWHPSVRQPRDVSDPARPVANKSGLRLAD